MAVSTIPERNFYIKLKHIPYEGLVLIPSLGDGNCYFHSILRAFYKNYIYAKNIRQRKKITEGFRYVLADMLGNIDPKTNTRYYDQLSRGELASFAEAFKDLGNESGRYTLKGMQKELCSSAPVSICYHELISNLLEKDIYYIDLVKEDVYIFSSDLDFLYKERDSIVVAYSPGHYDLIGVDEEKKYFSTLFTFRHPLIEMIRNRIKIILKK